MKNISFIWIDKRIMLAALLLPVLSLLWSGVHSAQGPAAFPVIVVLDDSTTFQQFEPLHRSDDRARANPEAWGYLHRGVVGSVMQLENRFGFRANHVYSRLLRGFSAHLTAKQIQALENELVVSYIEPDGIATVSAQTLPWGIDQIGADVSSTQAGNGSGAVTTVNAYIIDTGIAKHADLNVVGHVNFAGGKNTDCNGHGTHVAGTVGAKDNTRDVVGVAPGVRLIGVKVLGCNGSGWISNVIKGVDWVTNNAVEPAIANMSLGGGASQALDDAVKRSADSGVFYSVAAGNEGADACESSPARAGTHNGVMTTAATDQTNLEASWSNFGDCVDIWAPGVSILSTKKGGGTTTMSGTSMAAPHVGGTGALYLSSHGGASATEVESALKAAELTTGTTSKDGKPIGLVYSGGY